MLDVLTSQIETIEVPPTGSTEAEFDEWIVVGAEPCLYTWNYKAYLDDSELGNTELANSLSFNPQLRKFTVASDNSGNTYEIRLEGTLSDQKTVRQIEFSIEMPQVDEAPSIQLKSSYMVERLVASKGVPDTISIYLG